MFGFVDGNRRADICPWRVRPRNGVVLFMVIFHTIVFAATVHVARHVLKSCILCSKFFFFRHSLYSPANPNKRGSESVSKVRSEKKKEIQRNEKVNAIALENLRRLSRRKSIEGSFSDVFG